MIVFNHGYGYNSDIQDMPNIRVEPKRTVSDEVRWELIWD